MPWPNFDVISGRRRGPYQFPDVTAPGYCLAGVNGQKELGAVGDGVANDYPAFQNAVTVNEASGGGPIIVPPGTYRLASNLTGITKTVFWVWAATFTGPGASSVVPLVVISSAGAGIFPTFNATTPPPTQFFDAVGGATATDVANYKFYRNANYVGGTHGFVNGAVRIQTDVGAGTVAFEWGLVSLLNDNSTDATQENVAIVGQTNKNSVGGAWAGVFQATDNRVINDPTSALIGIEIDVTATGTDVNNQRLGMDIVLGTLGANPAAHAGIGIRVNAAGSAVWETGILLTNINNVALEIRPTAAVIGINLVNGTFSQAAIRLARQHRITLESSNTFQIETVGASDSIFKFINGGTEKVGIDLNTGLRMNTLQVVGARQTGYTNAWTGTLERATALATGSVTLVALAQRVAAIQTDLVAHGLLGP